MTLHNGTPPCGTLYNSADSHYTKDAQQDRLQDVYGRFLADKPILADLHGITRTQPLSPVLYDFQRYMVDRVLTWGRGAIFSDTGTGKSGMQVEFLRHIGGRSLIVAPLSIAEQTVEEARRLLDTEVRYVRAADSLAQTGIHITNYEMLKAFIGIPFDGIVLDESSILASLDGATKTLLLKEFTHIPYRLCCTATPIPNDIAEIANHSEFLGIMTRAQMLSTFFVHDETDWRLRGHAEKAFYRWLASWAIAMKNPADLGFDGTRFILPPLRYHQHVARTDWRKDGHLFAGGLQGITDRAQVRKRTVDDRIALAVDVVRKADGAVVVWCGLNDESRMIAKVLQGYGESVEELHGTQPLDTKLDLLRRFRAGDFRIMVTKPKIAGRGLNWQHAHTQVFLGLSDSMQDYYQCTRRLWRYGQWHPVDTHIIVSDHETAIVENVQCKEQEAAHLTQKLVAASAQALRVEAEPYQGLQVHTGPDWTFVHGDCVEAMQTMPAASVDLAVFSPPFMALYQYTGTVRDVGNSKCQRDFFRHFKFVAQELVRITKPGRVCCMHLAQVPAMQARDGYIGLKDFRGPMIACMESRGWIYYGECVIQRNPQAVAIRTHTKGLAFAQLEKDAAWMRPAIADMVLIFRAPGENAVPVKPECSNEEWITWAAPVWYDIRETHTLNAAEGRDNDDDLHIHPLQLDTIERCIRLYSNRGEVVFSPFAGIASEVYMALKHGRKAYGIELKASYVKAGLKNIARAEVERSQMGLFAS